MERTFYRKLVQWKTLKQRKPLIVRGARQVGKTFTIKQFGSRSFKGRIHIVDLEKHPDWKQVFEKNLEPARIIRTGNITELKN
jgi:uncharacterized protein